MELGLVISAWVICACSLAVTVFVVYHRWFDANEAYQMGYEEGRKSALRDGL